MKERMNIDKAEPRIYKAMDAAEKQLAGFDLDPRLTELVKLRASQINGCGYCVNMHSRDARKAGETEQRVYALRRHRSCSADLYGRSSQQLEQDRYFHAYGS